MENDNMWYFLKIDYWVGIVLAALAGIAIPIFPEQRELLTIVIHWTLAAGLVPIGFVIAVWFVYLATMFTIGTIQEALSLPEIRHWGYVFTSLGFIGLFLLMGVDGNDVMRSTTGSSWETVVTLTTISFSLIGLGWLVNHWPKRELKVKHIEFPGGWAERLE